MAEPNKKSTTQSLIDLVRESTDVQIQGAQKELERLEQPVLTAPTETLPAQAFEPVTPVEPSDEPQLEPGFRAVDEPGPYVGYPIGMIDPVLGTTTTRVFYTDKQRRDLQDSRQDPQLKYETIISPLTREQREHMAKVAPEKVDEDYLQKGLGLVNYYLSPFNLPESVAWTGMAYVAQALPNPGTLLGDIAESSFSAMYPYLGGQVIFSPKNAFDSDAPKDPEAEKAFEDAEGELTNKIYRDSNG